MSADEPRVMSGGKRKKKGKRRRGRMAVLFALFLAFLGVSGGGLWYQGQQGTARDRIVEETRLLPDFDPAAVIAISLEEPPRAAVEIERDESGRWQITAPSPHAADAGAVEDLLVRLQRAEVLASVPIESEAELATVGLDAPRLRLELRTGTSATAEISVGSEAVGTGSFARRSGASRIVTLKPGLVAALSAGLNGLRARELFGFDPEDVVGLDLLAPDHTLALRSGDGGWQLGESVSGAADRDQVTQLLRTITSLRAIEFLDEDPGVEATGLTWGPEVSLRVELAGGEKSEWLKIGSVARPGVRYARLGDQVLTLAEAPVTELLRDPARLKDRDLLDLEYDRVIALELRNAAGSEVSLSTDDEGRWRMSLGAGETVSATGVRVSEFLRELDRMVVLETEEGAGGLQTSPRLQVRLTLRGAEPVILDIEPPASGVATARISMTGGEAPIYRVGRALADALADAELTFRTRTVFAQVPAAAEGVAQMRLEQFPPDEPPRLYTLDRSDTGTWSDSGGRKIAPDVVDGIVGELQHLEARDFVARWDGQSRPEAAPTGDTVLGRVQLGQGDQAWQLTLYGLAPAHPGLIVCTSENVPFVLLLGEHTARRLLGSIE